MSKHNFSKEDIEEIVEMIRAGKITVEDTGIGRYLPGCRATLNQLLDEFHKPNVKS